jgi:Uma2 family endonuclease
MAAPPIRTKRWTRIEYDRLIECGFFQPGDRIELIGGELIVAEPKGTGHSTAVGLVEDILRAIFGPGWVVRGQDPIAPDDESEPEPDVAVVPGARRDYRDAHPTRPVLVVEVAESSLSFDREWKGSLYARAGIQDYWILNLVDRVLEVYREPVPDPSAYLGWRYALVEVHGPGATVTPLAAPASCVLVADLLP